MSKYAKIEGLPKFVFDLREAGTPWDKTGGIRDQVAAKWPEYTTKSAIPLRNIYNAYKAGQVADHKIKATPAKVVAARDGGIGWVALAGRTGKTVAELKKLYTDGGGTNPEGRVYVSQDGTVNVRLEATSAKPVPNAFPVELVQEALAELKEEQAAA